VLKVQRFASTPALILAFLFASNAAMATPVQFNIDSEEAPRSLLEFGRQSTLQILFETEKVKGVITNAVHGSYEPIDALNVLLRGTTLVGREKAGGVLVVELQGKSRGTSKVSPPTDAGSTQLVQSNAANTRASTGSPSGPSSSQAVQNDSANPNAGLAEILVKGSRIMNVDVTRTPDDPQPYYIFDSQTIEQSGATNAEDFLKQQLTMNTSFSANSQSPNSNAGNTSSINLRGLGSTETLILIDGRRSAAVTIDGTSGQPDINGIPLAAIERIEVLPSSASAIYGGAAIGGVINIVLKKNFSGGDFRYSYDYAGSGGAPRSTVNATYGFSPLSGTEIMVSGQYSDGKSLTLGDRQNLFERGIANIIQNDPSYLYGTSSPFPGATTNIGSVDGSNLVLKGGASLNSPITFVPPGSAPGTDISSGLLANAGKYNLNLSPGFGPYGLRTPIDSTPSDKTLMATIRQEVSSQLDAFLDVSANTNSSRSVNPVSTLYSIAASAAASPFQQDVNVSFPTTLAPPFTTESETMRGTLGLIAKLGADWRLELDDTFSRNRFSYDYDQTDGQAVLSDIQNGTLNPFVDTIAYPLAMSKYLAPTSGGGTSTLNDVALRASGSLFTFIGIKPTLTVGLEHRKEGFGNSDQFTTYPLNPQDSSDLHIFAQSQDTDSVYAEALFPLLTRDAAVPLVRSLELQLAGRSERYSVDAGTPYVYLLPLQSYNPPQGQRASVRYTSTNPTIALKYTPVDEISFRASYSTAFLPPTSGQLLPNLKPICGGPCIPITDPLTGAHYNVDFSAGGNPALQPQSSKDWDFGVIWTPTESILDGLRLNLQYYQITQPNYITTLSIQQILDNPSYAGRATRDPATGRITVVDDSPVNATLYKTAGLDLSMDYRRETTVGTFNFHAAGTRIDYDKRQFQAGGPLLEFVGFPGDGAEARYKATSTLLWQYNRWSTGWTVTYTGSYQQVGAPGDPFFVTTYFTAPQGGFTIPSQTYHSIFGSYAVKKGPSPLRSDFTIQFGIKNVFNKLPPYDVYNPSGFYSYYGDERLRSFWISIRKGF
jgi:iron complex outermembrane recepter protein